MADAGAELISQGVVKPSPLESVGKFVKEKIIDPHTPEAHYHDIMKKYFWVTDRMEGKSLELTRRLRPTVEIASRAAGWSQTFTELYFAGQAVAFLGFMGFRGLNSAAGVFGDMAKKHGGETVGAAATVVAASAPTAAPDAQAKVVVSATTSDVTVQTDVPTTRTKPIEKAGVQKKIYHHDARPTIKDVPEDEQETDDKFPKKPRLKAKVRRAQDRGRRGIPVGDDDGRGKSRRMVTPASYAAVGGNGSDVKGPVVRSTPNQEAISQAWSAAFDAAIGTDAQGVAQKEATLGLLNTMMMDKSNDGFFTALVGAMAESNEEVRKKMVETTVNEAAEAFGASDEVAAAAQLLIEYQTSQSITPASMGNI